MATVTLSKHPVFESITGLTNTTFDPENYQEDRMATEAQITQIERAIGDLQARKEHCCREIVTWRSYVRVIAENTGIVLSDWLDNMQVGSARRGEQFTVEFALPHDSDRYFDNRSSYKTGQGAYNNTYAVRVNLAGMAVRLEENFFAKGVSNANARPSSNNDNFDDNTKFWLRPSLYVYSSGLLLASGGSTLLPAVSNTSDLVDLYYIYKDTLNNKIKIDVKRSDQYAEGEYLALFFIQYVQRSGYTG